VALLPTVTDAPLATARPPLARSLGGVDAPGHLADGWESHRPVGDGLVRRFVHACASGERYSRP
jgi:hypothetical protein